MEPKPLVFPPSPESPQKGVPLEVPQATPSALWPAGSSGQQPPTPRGVAPLSFDSTQPHPALSQVLATALKMDTAIAAVDVERLSRYAAQLLPFSKENLLAYGEGSLRKTAQCVEAIARLTRQLAMLNVTQKLSDLNEACSSRKRLIERLIHPNPLSIEAARLQVEGLKSALAQLINPVKEARAAAHSAEKALDLRLLALRAADTVFSAKAPPDAREGSERKLGLLRNSLMQTKTCVMQGNNLETQIYQLIQDSDMLLAVTLPSTLLSRAAQLSSDRT